MASKNQFLWLGEKELKKLMDTIEVCVDNRFYEGNNTEDMYQSIYEHLTLYVKLKETREGLKK